MWKNIIELDRPQMTMWHVHIPCWITKSVDTHPVNIVLIDFLLQQWLYN